MTKGDVGFDAEDARAWLAEYFADEEGWQEEVPEELPGWFDNLGAYVAALPSQDSRLQEATVYLEPWTIEDEADPRYIDEVMYPDGRATSFLEGQWGGSSADFLTGFVAAMKIDFFAWREEYR
jgi:hypothetical protein